MADVSFPNQSPIQAKMHLSPTSAPQNEPSTDTPQLHLSFTNDLLKTEAQGMATPRFSLIQTNPGTAFKDLLGTIPELMPENATITNPAPPLPETDALLNPTTASPLTLRNSSTSLTLFPDSNKDRLKHPDLNDLSPALKTIDPFAEINQKFEHFNQNFIEKQILMDEIMNPVPKELDLKKDLNLTERTQLLFLNAQMSGNQASSFAQSLYSGKSAENTDTGAKESKTLQFSKTDFITFNMIRNVALFDELNALDALINKIESGSPPNPTESKLLKKFGMFWTPNKGLQTHTIDPTKQEKQQFIPVTLNQDEIAAIKAQIRLLNEASPALKNYLFLQCSFLSETLYLGKLQDASDEIIDAIDQTQKDLEAENAQVEKLHKKLKSLQTELEDYMTWGDKYTQALQQLQEATQTTPPQLNKLSPETMALLSTLGFEVDLKQGKISQNGQNVDLEQVIDAVLVGAERIQILIESYTKEDSALSKIKSEIEKSSQKQTELADKLKALDAKRQKAVEELQQAQKKHAETEAKLQEAFQALPPEEKKAVEPQYQKLKHYSDDVTQKTTPLIQKLVDKQPVIQRLLEKTKNLQKEVRLNLDAINQRIFHGHKVWEKLNDFFQNMAKSRLSEKGHSSKRQTAKQVAHQPTSPSFHAPKNPKRSGLPPSEEQEQNSSRHQAQINQQQREQQDSQMLEQRFRKEHLEKERDISLQAERDEKQHKMEQQLGIRDIP